MCLQENCQHNETNYNLESLEVSQWHSIKNFY